MKHKHIWISTKIVLMICFIINVKAESTDEKLAIIEHLFRSEINLLRINMRNEKMERDIINDKLNSVIKQVSALSTFSKEQKADAEQVTMQQAERPESVQERQGICTADLLERLLKGLHNEKRARKAHNQISVKLVEEARKEIATVKEERRNDIDLIHDKFVQDVEAINEINNKIFQMQDTLNGMKYEAVAMKQTVGVPAC